MPQVQLQRHEQILERQISRVVARTDLSDVADSSVFKQILAAVSREFDEGYFQLTRLTDLYSIDRAAGEDLDERAKDIQPGTLTRLSAAKAVGSLVFSRTGTVGDVAIPNGTVVKTADGIAVKTSIQGVIPNGSTTSAAVAAVAEEAGSEGNVAPNTLIRFGSKIPGIDAVTNTTSFTSGRDGESDDAFRARLKAFIRSLARSTVDTLEFVSIGIEDPASGKVVAFSHVFEDPVDRGNVTLYIDDGAGTAEETLDVAPFGSVDSISAPVAGIQTLTDLAGPFGPEHVGKSITISGAVNPTNDVTATILSVPDATQVTYANAPGVVEAVSTANFTIAPENLTEGLLGPPLDSAVGGEEFLFLDYAPVKIESGLTVTSSTRGALTEGVEYFLNPANGLMYFNPPLAATEVISVSYTFFKGLIAEVQKVVDGDPADRLTYPGFRAAGVLVRVLEPIVVVPTVTATLAIQSGFDRDTVIANAETAAQDYINNLGISGDVIRNELIERIMAISGVVDLTMSSPSANITVLDDEIARISSGNIDID